MMAKIIGMGPVIQGKSKRTGRDYYGQMLELTYNKRGVQGIAVKEQFISFFDLEEIPSFNLNQEIFLDYDDSGFLLEFEIMGSQK